MGCLVIAIRHITKIPRLPPTKIPIARMSSSRVIIVCPLNTLTVSGEAIVCFKANYMIAHFGIFVGKGSVNIA